MITIFDNINNYLIFEACKMKKYFNIGKYSLTLLIYLTNFWINWAVGKETITIGLNYPASGWYREQGIQQKRAAILAVDEINAAGGILNHSIQLVHWDSQADKELTIRNVTRMIEKDEAVMIFGSVSNADALAAGAICQSKNIPFFNTLAYADEITGSEAHRYVFRENYNAGMGAKALSEYLRNKFPANLNKYFYITTEDTWGKDSENELRANSNSKDIKIHKGMSLPFPTDYNSVWNAIKSAQVHKPDVLVLILFGNELVTALKLAAAIELKSNVQIVVPNITQGMAKSAGKEAIEGIISTTNWAWEIPYQYNYLRGQAFVESFFTRYGNPPSTSAASAYTVIYEYKAAVERAGTFAGPAVVRALEGHEYQLLKDKQMWRNFDHQSVQTVYLIRGSFRNKTLSEHSEQGFFEILDNIPGDKLVLSREEWNAARLLQGKPIELEELPAMITNKGNNF